MSYELPCAGFPSTCGAAVLFFSVIDKKMNEIYIIIYIMLDILFFIA